MVNVNVSRYAGYPRTPSAPKALGPRGSAEPVAVIEASSRREVQSAQSGWVRAPDLARVPGLRAAGLGRAEPAAGTSSASAASACRGFAPADPSPPWFRARFRFGASLATRWLSPASAAFAPERAPSGS